MNVLHPKDEIFDTDLKEVTMVVTSTTVTKGRIRVLILKDDEERVMRLENIRERISNGEISIRRPGAPLVSPARQPDARLQDATACALRVMHEVREYESRYNVSTCIAYERVKAQHQSSDIGVKFPSRATVYRYLKADRTGLPVLCGNKNKGNRTPRHDERIVALIADKARVLTETESRWSLRTVTKLCNRLAHDAGLLSASANISRRFVSKVVFEHISSDIDYDRMDPRTRAACKAVAKNRIRVDGFLQRVEQDAVHLPWCVRTEGGVAKDIWLVHAIDCATGMPVGWHLVVGSPSASDGLRCVERTLFSKAHRFAELGLDVDIDGYGAPASIVLDNGAEANNHRMKALTRLCIDIHFCKSRHPHHKPFVERLNRSLKEYLETLPGCTRFDGKDGKRDPETLNDLPMDLFELESRIVRWYFKVWANTPLERLVRSEFFDDRKLGGTPRARLESMNRLGYAMPLPPNTHDWLMVQYEHHERTLARTTGISYAGFHFRGRNLDRLIARYGERSVTVLVDPDDYRTVQVLDGDELVPLVNIDVDEATPALSFEDAKARHKDGMARAAEAGAADIASFDRDMHARSLERPTKNAGKTSATERARQVRRQVKGRAAVERSRTNPLPASDHVPPVDDSLSLGSVESLSIIHRTTGAAA
jgi:putative transposase